MAAEDGARSGALAALAWSLVVAVLLTAPGTDLGWPAPSWLDKPVHGLLFAVHCLLLARPLAARWPAGRAGIAAAAVLSGLYAAVLEAAQIPVPGRSWEWWDLAAGLLGIGLAAALLARRHASL